MKKFVLAAMAVLFTAAFGFALYGCSSGEDGQSSGGEPTEELPEEEFSAGSTIDESKEAVFVRYTDDGEEYSYTAMLYSVKYLVKDGSESYITLSGESLSDMRITGYGGAIASLNVAEVEENVRIGENSISVGGIGEKAFASCTTLVSVDMTKITTSLAFTVGEDAFLNCTSLTSVVLPENVYTGGNAISDGAFSGCAKLSSVTLTEKFSSVGKNAFSGCTSLTGIALPSSVSVLSEGVFSGCGNLSSVSCGKLISIQSSALRNTAVSSFTFAEGLTYIGDGAFEGTLLKSCTLPATVSFIGEKAFYNIASLKSVSAPFTGIDSSGGAVTFNSVFGADESAERELDVTLSSVVKIGEGAFMNSDVANLTISSFAEAGDYKIYAEDGLTYSSVAVSPEYIIGDRAFYNSSVKSVSFPNGVTGIGDEAFSRCVALTDLSLPQTVKSYGSAVVADSYNLTSLSVGGAGWQGEDGYLSVTKANLFSVQTSFANLAEAGEGGAALYTDEEGYYIPSSLKTLSLGSVYTIADNFLCGWTNLKEFTAEFSEITEDGGACGQIGDNAFSGCTGLSLTFINAEGVIKIGERAFGGVSVTTDMLSAFSSLKEIGAYAFENCGLAGDVVLPDTLKSIGENAFFGCADITSLTMKRYTEVPAYKLFGAEEASDEYYSTGYGLVPVALESVSLYLAESLPDYSFYGMEKLKSLSVSSSAFGAETAGEIKIGNASLQYLGGLVELDMILSPESFSLNVPLVGMNAISSLKVCLGLNQETTLQLGVLFGEDNSALPEGLSAVELADGKSFAIPAGFLKDAKNVTSVTFDGSHLTKIGKDAFSGCGVLESAEAEKVTATILPAEGSVAEKLTETTTLLHGWIVATTASLPTVNDTYNFCIPSDTCGVADSVFGTSATDSFYYMGEDITAYKKIKRGEGNTSMKEHIYISDGTAWVLQTSVSFD